MSTDPRDSNERQPADLSAPAQPAEQPATGADCPATQPSPITSDSPETGEQPAASPVNSQDAAAKQDDESSPSDNGRQPAADDALPDDEDQDEDEQDEEEDSGPVEPIEEAAAEPAPEDLEFRWYILKVQVNREDSIREALQRRISRAGLDAYFGDIVVPTEDVVEFNKNGKKRTVKRKLYPGYIIVNMGLTEETWFLVRETPGIGDFTGSAGKPTPMDADEVRRIIKPKGEVTEGAEEVRIAIPFNVGDRVRVKEGYFQNFEGDVESIDQANGRVTVMINIFGRSTPVELQHWQMERV